MKWYRLPILFALLLFFLNTPGKTKYKDDLIIKGNISDFQVIDDGKYLLFPKENKLYVWDVGRDVVTDSLIFNISGSISAIDYTPDQKLIAVCFQTGEVLISNLEGEYHLLKNIQNRIISLKFSNDGNYLAMGSVDNSLSLWNTVDRKKLWKSEGHKDHILAICFSPNDSVFYTGSADSRIGMWKTKNGEALRFLDESNSWVRKLLIANENELYATTDLGYMYNWSITKDEPAFLRKEKIAGSWIISFCKKGDTSAFGDRNGNVLIKSKFATYKMNLKKPILDLDFIITHEGMINVLISVMNSGIYKIGLSDMEIETGTK